jgi:hypothetical protein
MSSDLKTDDPLMEALNQERPLAEIIPLLESGAKVSADHITVALLYEDDDVASSILTALVKFGGKVDTTHIQNRLEYRRRILETLVKLGGKIDTSHIEYALQKCCERILLKLIKLGGKVDESHIELAIKRRMHSVDFIVIFVKFGVKVNDSHIQIAKKNNWQSYGDLSIDIIQKFVEKLSPDEVVSNMRDLKS